MVWKLFSFQPKYRETRPFTEPVPQAAYETRGLAMDQILGIGGELVIGQLAAFQPAFVQPTNQQVQDNVYGRGGVPNYLIRQQALTDNPLGDPATTVVGSI